MKPDSCMSCGGPVDEHGMYAGGEVADTTINDDDETSQDEESEDSTADARKAFVRAVRLKGGR